MADSGLHEEVGLAGRFRLISLGEVVQMLGSNGSTGVLSIRSRYASEPGLVYFSKGSPVNAACLKQTGIEALYSLFGWTDGEFEFRDMSRVDTERSINAGLMEIVMDGARMLDDGQIKVLGPDTAEELTGEKPAAPARKRPKLKGIPIIRLHLKNQKQVTGEKRFSRNQPIVDPQDGAKPWLYVMLKGFANVYRDSGQGPVRICRLGPGALIGNIPSFTNPESAKNIKVTAAGEVSLGEFDRAGLTRDFASMSYQLRRLCLSLDNRWSQLTRRVTEANNGGPDMGFLKQKTRSVINQGESHTDAYLITEGRAWVVRKDGEGVVPLCELVQGDFVGHLPFMPIGHEPNQAMVLSTPNFKTRRIDLERMQAEYDLMPPLVKNFVEYIANCVSITTMVACDLIPPMAPKD